MFDILLHEVRLMDGRLVDVAIADGVIAAVNDHQHNPLPHSAKQLLAGKGRLLLPAFVNGQLHSCKVFWRRGLEQLPAAQQALPRFEAAHFVKQRYQPEEVYARVDEVMRLAIRQGSCAIRLFADVDEASGLRALEALLQIRQRYQAYMQVQVIAFPQDGVSAATEKLMHEAMERGADGVGGIPWIEADSAAQRAHTDMCIALAQAHHAPLHMVCDDTTNPDSRTLEYLAEQVIAAGMQGQVAATQCAALAFYDDAYAAQVIAKVKAAELTIFSNSQVSLVTTEADREPYPRGITRVRALLEAGVPVACAQDDIDNWYYPFGRNDMLEVAQFMAHTANLAWPQDIAKVLPMVTQVPATLLGLQRYPMHMQPDDSADVVLLEAADWHSALQFQAPRRYVILRGQLVAENKLHSTMYLEPSV